MTANQRSANQNHITLNTSAGNDITTTTGSTTPSIGRVQPDRRERPVRHARPPMGKSRAVIHRRLRADCRASAEAAPAGEAAAAVGAGMRMRRRKWRWPSGRLGG
uniref:(northern house mosquito) hypothetical protein n=1 Tax=Culex pipiens TaxID=7175 RepID=A0A8D8F2E2_CULPI